MPTKKTRQTFTPEQRGDILREFHASGMTQVAFAEQRGISSQTLLRWLQSEKQQGGLPARVVGSASNDTEASALVGALPPGSRGGRGSKKMAAHGKSSKKNGRGQHVDEFAFSAPANGISADAQAIAAKLQRAEAREADERAVLKSANEALQAENARLRTAVKMLSGSL